MASSPTTSWHIDERKVETVTDFIFLVFKNTKDLECSYKIKRHLLLGRKKGYEKHAQCIKKAETHFDTEVSSVKSMIFSVIMYRCENWRIMYRCENWTIKKLIIKELILLNCGVREDS